MKLRSFLSGLTIVVVLLLLIAVASFYWLTAQNPLGLLKGGQDTPGAAIFVPKQAPAMVSLLVNPEQLENFRLLAARPQERRQARAELDQLKQMATTGLDYKRDIQPWLGQEVTLALTTLDIDRDSLNGRQPGYLLALATQNTQRSREFLQLFWQKRAVAGADLTFEQYKGVKLIYASPAPHPVQPQATGFYKRQPLQRNASSTDTPPLTPALASAVVGDRYVLFANHPKVLRDAINNVQAADLNLSRAEFYTQSVQTLSRPRIGLLFANLPQLSGWLAGDSAPPELRQVKADAFTSSEPGTTDQTLAIGLKLHHQGILAETALLAIGDALSRQPTLSQPVEALKYIPRSSPISASGADLNQLWTQLSAGASGDRTVSQLIQQPLLNLQARWQIDLANDIFSWATGEYALALLPTPPLQSGLEGRQAAGRRKKGVGNEQISASSLLSRAVGDDWIFVAKRPNDANQAIAHLDDIARQQGLSVGSLKLGDRTISAWTQLTTAAHPQSLDLQAEVKGVHTSVGNYELFATSIAAMDQALKAPEDSLLIGDQFKQAIAPLAEPNHGYLYFDWLASQPLLERQFPLLKLAELVAQPLFNHLRSLTVSSYGNQSSVQRGEVFIQLRQSMTQD